MDQQRLISCACISQAAKLQLLPVTSDLVKLKEYQYQVRQIGEITAQLHSQPDNGAWRLMMEHVYTRVVIFNKRWCSKTAKLLSQAYLEIPRWEEAVQDDIVKSLGRILLVTILHTPVDLCYGGL